LIPIKETKSICPICFRVVEAQIYQSDGKVFITKSCPEHGSYEDLYWSDYEQYLRVQKFRKDGSGVENPRTKVARGCPYDCGLCPNHKSYTILGIIDVTNRCNLRCPICFANAAAAGYLYEPSKDEIFAMIDNLVANRPVSTKALQFSGGEPTLREDLPELIKRAREAGIPHVEVNTNGIRIANSLEYAQSLADAGVNTFYLQFDGVSREPYLTTRGVDLLQTKMKALENLRKVGHESTVLVVTLVKGVNDNQLGDIIRFAANNFDIVRCVNVQPVSITGRIDRQKLREYRITIPDFMKLVEEQTEGQITRDDFYPVPSVVPFARAMAAFKGKPYPEFTMHEHCGMATFVFVEDGKLVPITQYADVDSFMKVMDEVTQLALAGKKTRAKMKMITALRHLKVKVLSSLLSGIIKEGSYSALGQLMRRVVMVSSMHFMDGYNFDLERVQRCGIHYAVPDGRIIPFCTMNTLHRQEIERRFAKEIEELPTPKAA
jgi:hypothetical protein